MLRRGVAIALVLISLLSLSGTVLAEDKIGYVTSTGLYIRRQPDAKSEALRCAVNGEQLIILRTEGDWYYVKYNDVVSGYVAKRYVSTKKPATAAESSSSGSSSSQESLPAKVTDLGGSPASSRLGDRGSHVKRLQQALSILGYYRGDCDGVFGEGTEKAVKEFQGAKGLSKDGVAGKVTIKVLFGEEAADAGVKASATSTPKIVTGAGATAKPSASVSASATSASGGKVEKVDWFSGGDNIIPKGATFTLKDIRTGITIKCRHLYGANHLDAEPLTSEETAKLKKVYGGEWSWARRPILVSYNGRILAASMNGMPHGEQTILDNDFDGQFCIHFTGSKTHGSSNVDPDHQACIEEAAKASW